MWHQEKQPPPYISTLSKLCQINGPSGALTLSLKCNCESPTISYYFNLSTNVIAYLPLPCSHEKGDKSLPLVHEKTKVDQFIPIVAGRTNVVELPQPLHNHTNLTSAAHGYRGEAERYIFSVILYADTSRPPAPPAET